MASKTLAVLLLALLTVSACEPTKDVVASEQRALKPDCNNLANLILQDIAEATQKVCQQHGVVLPAQSLHTIFAEDIYNNSEFSAATCQATCTRLEQEENENMTYCVNLIKNGFMRGFRSSFIDAHMTSTENCNKVKDQL